MVKNSDTSVYSKEQSPSSAAPPVAKFLRIKFSPLFVVVIIHVNFWIPMSLLEELKPQSIWLNLSCRQIIGAIA